MIIKTQGIYFIDDGDNIRIGESTDLDERLKTHRSSRGKNKTLLRNFMPLPDDTQGELFTAEEAAFEYFKDFRVKGETKSFYTRDILPLIADYITTITIEKYNVEQNKIENTGTIQTVYGQECLSVLRKKCDVFPEQDVAYYGKAGTHQGEKSRKFIFEGQIFHVGSKAKALFQLIIRDTKKKCLKEFQETGTIDIKSDHVVNGLVNFFK